MKKSLFAGLFSILFLLIIVTVSHPQGHFIGGCPELKPWKNNQLFLEAKDMYSRGSSPQVNNEWQRIANKVDEFDAEMTEFVRTCSELKARADATNSELEEYNRRSAEWNNRWSGRPWNSAAMAEKNALEAQGNRILSEQRDRNAEWSQMTAQRNTLNAKYKQLEQEIPQFISSMQRMGTGGTPKSAGKAFPGAAADLKKVVKWSGPWNEEKKDSVVKALGGFNNNKLRDWIAANVKFEVVTDPGLKGKRPSPWASDSKLYFSDYFFDPNTSYARKENLIAFEAGKAFLLGEGKTLKNWFMNNIGFKESLISELKNSKHNNDDLSDITDLPGDTYSGFGYLFRAQALGLKSNTPEGQKAQREFKRHIDPLMQGNR